MHNKNNDNSSFFKVIELLRFPLIICVIFIHNHPYNANACNINSYVGG